MAERVQAFEEDLFPTLGTAIQEGEISYRPSTSILSEPVDVLHCDGTTAKWCFQKTLGSWRYRAARRGTATAGRSYSARIGPVPLAGMPVRLFSDGRLVKTYSTDDEGKVSLPLPVEPATRKTYTATLLDRPTGLKNPLEDVFDLAVWLVTCRSRNISDVWARFQGRSVEVDLPRAFWKYPGFLIGLAGFSAGWVDIVPVFGDKEVTLEYGVSAYCNTPEARPGREKCLAARPKTWWRFDIHCNNGKVEKTVSGNLNIDRHLKVRLTTDDVSGEVVIPAGAET
ncbi:MAG: hypothetical protein JRD89_00595 [Deltaproteobacteria bacterium]|nr:hypothetical protein [Deltaproteobacteria bacterium]